MKSIQYFKEFKEKNSKLDILYNNTAVMKTKRTLTNDGFEMMFQVNYLTPFILMNAFLELMKNSFLPYIINNGRPADKYRLDINDLQFEKNTICIIFFMTKLYLLFSSLELSRKLQSDSIIATMIDPGPFKSDLLTDVPLRGGLKFNIRLSG